MGCIMTMQRSCLDALYLPFGTEERLMERMLNSWWRRSRGNI